ncbi:MAG: 50S ribosomal protein L9 [Opitutales bacterium]|jgi:large subunit ribosomal protein L9|tara:strand:+ start:180 stop:653 length:474 start_codon:yes stop_codon:yes gene_type:complete
MATTEILLVEHINNLGSEGDVVKVRPGYARNYLLPQKKAVPLNHANKKRLDALKVSRAARETDELQKSQEIATKLKETKIAVAVKTGAGGKLFGSVTVNHILEKLNERGFIFDKKHITSFSPIKELGISKISISLHKDVEAEVEVEVVSENPIEDSQ